MAKSLAPTNIPQLLELLAQSGLLAPEPLQQARQAAAAAAEVSDALELWIAAQWISPWQGAQLAAGQFVLKLGPYVLLDESQEWDFGRAFQARHLPTKQVVSLKLLANRWLQPDERWRQTASQLKTSQTLQSPHLITFQKVQRVAQRTFLISQHEPCSQLHEQILHYGPPTPDQVARLVREAALGIAELHEAGIPHGCLRPQCFTITPAGALRIHDPGLAPLAPSLFELRRQSAAKAHTDSLLPVDPFLPPETGIANVTSFRWDVGQLARLGLLLLELDATRKAQPTSERPVESPPSWWSSPSPPSAESLESLRCLLEEVSDHTDPSWSAPQLVLALEEWLQTEATLSIPKRTPENRPIAHTTSVTIDTRRRRKRPLPKDDQRLTGVRRLRRRRAAWLYGSLTATVAVVLLLVAVSLWKPSGEGETANPLARQDAGANPEAPRPEGEGASADDAGGLPRPDSLDFPTPEMFAAARADAQPSSPERVASPTGPPADGAEGGPAVGPAAVPGAADLAAVEPAPDATAPSLPNGTDPTVSPTDTGAGADLVAATTPDPASHGTTGGESATPTPAAAESAPRLANLPASVALPELEKSSASPVAILPLSIEPNISVDLTLLGGDRVLQGNSTLQIDHAEGGTAERMWDIRWVQRNAPPTIVARLTLENGELLFQWLDDARERPEPAQLMNCALNIAVGVETHRVYLRRPIEVAAPTMDFVRGTSTVRWEIPHAPDTAQCHLEFLGLEGPFPATRQLPSDNLTGVHGEHWILVGEEPAEQGLTFHLAAQWRRQIELTITSLLFVGDAPSPQVARNSSLKFNTGNRRRWLQTSEGRLRQAAQQLAQINAIDPKSFASRGEEQEFLRGKNLAELDFQAAQLDRTRMQTLEQWASTMHEQGKLHFRIYFEFGANQVELLRTEGAKPQS